jgi:hypothetical protein
LDAGRITTGERNAAFLLGFHPEDVKALRERLIAKKPDTPKGRAFDIKDVLDTARAIFSGDDDLLQPPTRASRHKDKSPEEEEKELDELIRKLYSYSVRDMEYAALHARCIRRFPDVARELPKPELQSGPTAAYSYQAAPLPAPPQQPWHARAPAPTPASIPPPVVASSADSFFRSRPSGCNFCGLQGHQIRDC